MKQAKSPTVPSADTLPQSSPNSGVVLFIGGWGRSGSTLLECLLAETGNVTVLGEVVHLWERGLRRNERCACGEQFHSCSFWQAVGEQAFAGWDRVDADRLAYLRNAVDRQRRILDTGRRRLPPRLDPLVAEYDDYYRRIYEAARRLTGARVVVDSSKEIATALALSHDPRIALRAVHIVRDSRGVAFSWSKTVKRPESLDGGVMTRYSASRSTVFWLSGNLLAGLLPRRGVAMTRMRYEDLVEDPSGAIAEIWRRLNLPGPGTLPMSGPHEVDLRGTHSVAGNPMRFRRGPTELRPDVQWRSAMSRRDMAVVTALSFPLLRFFGYPIRARPEHREEALR